MVTPVEIINGTMNVTIDQIQDSSFAILASLSSLVLALFAVLGYIKTSRETKKSVTLYDTDLKSRLRPWVFPFDFRPSYANLKKQGMDFKDWALNPDKYPEEPITVRIAVKLKNTGLLPANNFQFKVFLKIGEIQRNEIEQEAYFSSIRTIFPNEEFDADVDIDYSTFKTSEEGGSLWLAFMCKYDIDENREQITGLIGYLSKGSARRRDTWTQELKKNDERKSRGRR